MTFIYITCKNQEEADKISLHLLKKRLIACSNMFPINSMFWWKNNIEKSVETVVLAKTQRKNYNKIKTEVKKIHSYDTPCICIIDAKSNSKFESWVKKETK